MDHLSVCENWKDYKVNRKTRLIFPRNGSKIISVLLLMELYQQMQIFYNPDLFKPKIYMEQQAAT